MPSPTHFRYAISSTNAAAVAQKKPAARPSQTPGASEPPGAGWAHPALYRELHCRHFIRTSQFQAGFGSKRTCDYAFPGPHGRTSVRDAIHQAFRVKAPVRIGLHRHGDTAVQRELRRGSYRIRPRSKDRKGLPAAHRLVKSGCSGESNASYLPESTASLGSLIQHGAIGTHLFRRLIGEAELELAGGGEPNVAAAAVCSDEYALSAS